MNRREWGYWVWIVCDPRYLFLFTYVAHLLTFIWLISFIHPTFLWCFISRGGKLCELRWNTSTRRGKLFRLSFLKHLHLSLLDFLALHQVDSWAFWCPLLLVCFFFFFFFPVTWWKDFYEFAKCIFVFLKINLGFYHFVFSKSA